MVPYNQSDKLIRGYSGKTEHWKWLALFFHLKFLEEWFLQHDKMK